jgi:hypothetical protein
MQMAYSRYFLGVLILSILFGAAGALFAAVSATHKDPQSSTLTSGFAGLLIGSTYGVIVGSSLRVLLCYGGRILAVLCAHSSTTSEADSTSKEQER